jgi:hypothetical protein
MATFRISDCGLRMHRVALETAIEAPSESAIQSAIESAIRIPHSAFRNPQPAI